MWSQGEIKGRMRRRRGNMSCCFVDHTCCAPGLCDVTCYIAVSVSRYNHIKGLASEQDHPSTPLSLSMSLSSSPFALSCRRRSHSASSPSPSPAPASSWRPAPKRAHSSHRDTPTLPDSQRCHLDIWRTGKRLRRDISVRVSLSLRLSSSHCGPSLALSSNSKFHARLGRQSHYELRFISPPHASLPCFVCRLSSLLQRQYHYSQFPQPLFRRVPS